MQLDPRVSSYMDEIGLKYIKNAKDFVSGLAWRTDRAYAKQVADELNSRAGGSGSGQGFYKMKNENSLVGSLFISSAFDGGVFRHIGNIIAQNPGLFTGRVLDIGCDCGIAGCFIAKTYPGCTVVSVDKNELAVQRGKELADKLKLSNITFEVCDILKEIPNGEFDTAVSFRTLLDICAANTANLPFFGPRAVREDMYAVAFSGFAKQIGNALKAGGHFISVERYTADYGWLGWMQALESAGLQVISDKCEEMRASDISSVKAYSVTFAQKNDTDGSHALASYDKVMSAAFKSGASCDGAQAEYSLYNDCEQTVKCHVVYNTNDKPVHQYAVIKNKSDKIGFYEAYGNTKRIRFVNQKKAEALIKDIDNKLSTLDSSAYTVKNEL